VVPGCDEGHDCGLGFLAWTHTDGGQHGNLDPFQEILQHHRAASITQAAVQHEGPQRLVGLGQVFRDDDTLSSRQSIGFHDQRQRG